MEIILEKVNGVLRPINDCERKKLDAVKAGVGVRVKLTRVRNYQFLKKYFALLNLAYDYWTPDEGNQVAVKNFERFRKDIIILAGFYESYVRVDGSTRIEPKSISFGSMNEDEFAELYTKTIDAIIHYVLPRFTGDELRELVRAIEDFE
jgi:hypothetical protein